MGLYTGASCLCLFLLGSWLGDLVAITRQAVDIHEISCMRPFIIPKGSLILRLASSSARRIRSLDEPTIRIKPTRDIRAKSHVHSRTLPDSESSYSRKNVPHKMVVFRARVPRPLVLGLLIKIDVTTIGALMPILWILRLQFLACDLYEPRGSW